VGQQPADGPVEQWTGGLRGQPERSHSAEERDDTGDAVRNPKINPTRPVVVLARAEPRRRCPPVDAVPVVPGPLGELLEDAEDALRGAGTRPSGQRIDANSCEPVDKVVRRMLRIPPQQARQRLVDVAVAVLFAFGAEQPVRRLGRPGDPGESGVQRACERFGRQHVDGLLKAAEGSVGCPPVVACPSELSVADSQPGGAERQGCVPVASIGRGIRRGIRRGADDFGERAG
jgi:hypothetical protein